MDHKAPAPSSSTSGFFQALPILPPQYTCRRSLQSAASSKYKNSTDVSDDKVLSRILNLYIPSNASAVTQHVHHIARLALNPSVLVHSTDAETNHPVLRPLTTFGEENKNDPLWTTIGWKKLKEISCREGIVGVAFDPANSSLNARVYQFALNHVWLCTATMTGCPMSMTDGAAVLMSKHLADEDGDQPERNKVFNEAFRRLTSRDPELTWTSGQWMTERTGGSDVSGTETTATRLTEQQLAQDSKDGRDIDAVGMPLGPWRIDGFKWFSSATDSEMCVMLARTLKGGLSAFYAPMRRRVANKVPPSNIINEEDPPRSELNGIRIQRLKNKLGTKSLPTAELELKGTRAWLIGTEGQGVKEISAILNITRLHTAASSAGSWSRGLAVCRAYAKVRKVRGGLLQDNPAHLRWMADETVKYWAATHFAFFGVALQGTFERGWSQAMANTNASRLIPQEKSEAEVLLRLLTPVMKAQVSVASVHGLRQCMECLGGVGYCENNEDGGLLNIAKTYRDNLVNPIWEGTVSVMAEDVVRVLLDRRLGGGNVLENVFVLWVRNILGICSKTFSQEISSLEERLNVLIRLTDDSHKEQLLYVGREIVEHIEAIVCGLLLLFDATVDHDRTVEEIAKRWIRTKVQPSLQTNPWKKEVEMDKKIFLGRSNAENSQKLERL